MGLSNRQRVFVEEYLKCWVASEAVRRAGYKSKPNVKGAQLLANVSIAAELKQRISERAMGKDEVVDRLGEHARGDMGDFMDIGSMAFSLDLNKAKELGLTRLIKKVRQKTVTTVAKDGTEEETSTIEIELYDAQAALVQLGKHLDIFKENVDITSGGKVIEVIVKKRDE